jgi:hypothetical protein
MQKHHDRAGARLDEMEPDARLDFGSPMRE